MSTHGRPLTADIAHDAAAHDTELQDGTAPADAARPGQLDALESLARHYGRTYDAYLALDSDRQHFWSSSGQGAVAYVQRGRCLHIAGGLLAADEHKEPLLTELMAFAASRRLHLTFYNITDGDLPLFARYSFQTTKWGEEAIVDLNDALFNGKAFEWVRRQANYCQRQGLVFSEAAHASLDDEAWHSLLAEVGAIVLSPLDRKPQTGEIRFLEGRFEPERMAGRRVFVARNPAGILEGVLIANPARGGRSWVFETYRRRVGGIRGSITFLMQQALELLRAEGASEVSMCLIPGLHCREPQPGDSRLVRWALVLGSHINWIFDTAGLYQFKTRFRPRFESRYLCAYPRATLASLASFVHVLGVLDLSPRKLPRVLFSKIKRR